MKYTELTFSELVNKIGSSRFFDLPKMLKEIFTRINNIPTYEPKYKVYTALLTQTGTNAPTAEVLENTLGGDIVWIRDDVGYYIGEFSGISPTKTTVIVGNSTTAFQQDAVLIVTGVSNGSLELGTSLINLSIADFVSEDDKLSNTPLEIRVYS